MYSFTPCRPKVGGFPFCKNILALAIATTTAIPVVSQAQSGTDAMFEEVVVTARKKEESLQDAPLAVTAFSGAGLEARGVENISEIGALTPNLTYQNNPQAGGSSSVASVYIRGVGQRDFLGTIDNGVGFYIDEVYIARTVGATVDLVDVERVEVLKGPQGTLFGRNNVGGAVAIHSKKPSEEFEGYVDLTAGTDSLFKVKANVNLPVSENFLTSFSIMDGQQDGYVSRPGPAEGSEFASDSDADRGDLGDDNVTAVRAGFLFTPTDSLELYLTADYSDEEENGPAFQLLEAGTLVAGGFAGFHNNVAFADDCAYPGGISSTNPTCYNEQWATETNQGTAPTYSDTETWGTNLRVKWDLGDYLDIKSVTAYRELDAEFARDADASPLTVVHFYDDFETEQFSQEFNFSGSFADEKFDWLVGLYYFEEEGKNINVLDFAIANFTSDNDFTTESKAIYAQGTWKIIESLALTLGVRYTDEEKTFDPVQLVGPNNIGIPVGAEILPLGENSIEADETTPMLNLAWYATDETMLYYTYSEGFRSGGFVQRIFPPLPVVPSFDPEFVEAHEIGFKYNSSALPLTVNAAAFWMDYTDIQVRTQNPGFVGFFEDNVGNAEISGFEVEAKWSITDSLFVEMATGYTNAEYTEIEIEAPLVAVITEDSEFDHVPEWSGSMSIAYDFDFDAGTLTTRLSGNFHSEYFNNAENSDVTETPSVELLDLNLVWNSADEKYGVDFGIKNLTDEKYLATGYNNPSIGTAEVIYDRGREWYASLRYNF